MQDIYEDTEWNDQLRKRGIIPQKECEIKEEDIIDIVEQTIASKQNRESALEGKTLDELDELEDEEEERILLMMRNRRMAEILEKQSKAKFGSVLEISACDYVKEVNQAGEGVNVVLHLYKQGIPLCSLINQYLEVLAVKFPMVKFIKSISTTCIPNYPDKNLPTLFCYFENQMKHQIVGPTAFNELKLKQDDLEWMLHRKGVLQSSLQRSMASDWEVNDDLFKAENTMIKQIRQSTLRGYNDSDSD